MSEDNRLKKLRRRAGRVGYSIKKGYQHWLTEGYPVYYGCNGDKSIGYMIINDSIGFVVWGSCNELHDHAMNLDDVEEFIRDEYQRLELVF